MNRTMRSRLPLFSSALAFILTTLVMATMTSSCSRGTAQPSHFEDAPAALSAELRESSSSVRVAPSRDASKEPALVRVHYHRFDGDYAGLGLWTWDKDNGRQPAEQELLPAGATDYGVYWEIDPGAYGPEGVPAEIGFIARLGGSWDRKDGTDRFWRPSHGDEIWLVGNDPDIYTERPDTAPRVQLAFIDAETEIMVRLSHGMELSQVIPSTFQVRSAAGPLYRVHSARALDARDGKARLIELILAEPLDYKHEIAVLAEGYRAGTATLRELLFDAEKFSTTEQMGAIWSAEATTFRVFAPTAEEVKVVLYDEPTGPAGRLEVSLKYKDKGVWEGRADGDLHGKHYMLWVDADGPSTRMEVYDPYARCTTGHDGRGKILDMRRTDPPGFRPLYRPKNMRHATDAIIWEAHIRDFSISPHSGISDANKGKYLGLTELNTSLPDAKAIKTGLSHVRDLGITHLQLLPFQDFDNNEASKQYNWGYMPSQFDSPDGWYASNVRDESRIIETKKMIKAIHDQGMRVVLDVVYNHTSPRATFESIVPGYYHRTRDDGSFWNGSGTGNEFRSESPMGRRFIVDSCLYWVNEFGIDGFRFDLMGLVDLETLLELRAELDKIDPTIMLYGEPWAATGPDGAGIKRITYKDVVKGTNIGAFNDHFRNDLKGSPDGDGPGFVQHGGNRDGIKRGIMGAIHDWAQHPTQAIQYADCHDNLTLWDKLEVSAKDATPDDRRRMMFLATGVLGVSQGVMFLNAGHEFARTKFGDHNSYSSSDDVNMLKWDRLKEFGDLHNYTRGVIAIRAAHPIFRLPTREEVEKRLKFRDDLAPNNRTIAFSLDGTGLDGEAWETIMVFINGDSQVQKFELPEGTWNLHMHNTLAGNNPVGEKAGPIVVPPRSVSMLVLQPAME